MTMKLQTAIVGLPNVGKSTLFNALTESQGAEAANYPFCTIESNVGIVTVPDPKLDALGKLHESEKVIPAALELRPSTAMSKSVCRLASRQMAERGLRALS